MSNLFEHCRTGVSSASQRYEKPEAMQINLLFAEAKYSRCSQSAISLCQSAAGGGCVGRLWRDDAALRMGRLRAAALRVLTEERIFLAEFDCEHVRNIPTFDWAFPERSRFTTFCHRKVVPKVSARRKAAGNSQRLAKTGACRGFASKPAPFFNARCCSFLFPHFSQGGTIVRCARR